MLVLWAADGPRSVGELARPAPGHQRTLTPLLKRLDAATTRALRDSLALVTKALEQASPTPDR